MLYSMRFVLNAFASPMGIFWPGALGPKNIVGFTEYLVSDRRWFFKERLTGGNIDVWVCFSKFPYFLFSKRFAGSVNRPRASTGFEGLFPRNFVPTYVERSNGDTDIVATVRTLICEKNVWIGSS